MNAHSPGGAGPAAASPSARSRTEPRLPKDNREFTRQGAQGGEHGSKTKPGLSARGVPSSLRRRPAIRGAYRAPRAGLAPFAPSQRGAKLGWSRSWGMSQVHPIGATSCGKPPSSTRRGEGTKSNLCQAKHPTGTDRNTTQKPGFQRAFVCNVASPTRPSLPPGSHISPLPTPLFPGRGVKADETFAFPTSATAQQPPKSQQRAKQQEMSFS